MKSFVRLLCAALAFSVPVAHAADFPVVELSVGIYRIEAEVAYTEPAREQGLMRRKAMPVWHGMLFVFERGASHCMWMRNTLLPLSVAFLDGDGRVINVEDMQPQTDNVHCATRPARYALEMNLNWFRERGLHAGSTINGLDRAPAAQ